MLPAELTLHLPDATPIRLRPPRPTDAGVLGRLVEALSADDRRRRFHGAVRALSTQTLERMVAPAETTLALVAEEARGGLVADVRAVLDATGRDAEFGLMVATGWQGRGLGRLALRALCGAAAARGWGWLYGHVLADNTPMLGLAARCGFRAARHRGEPGIVVVETRLAPALPLAA
jgi:acetyltransferase